MVDVDTIAAISTAPGEGAIGIVRLSGSRSLDIVSSIFRSKGDKDIKKVKSHTIHYGYIYDPESGLNIDEVLVTVMRAPHTYTREDIVEINCHGGPIPLKRILELVLRMGARIAEPGEFTKRAFLNGRIDFLQAEAVIDIIRAKTELSLNTAMRQLEGGLSQKINEIKNILLNLMALLEVCIDFPEEDVEPPSYEYIIEEIQKAIYLSEKLIKTAEAGKILREGLKVAIVGKPNVGKSSLLNALLREGRAIVTEIPGTTRDVIEEYININGIPIKIIDTAGIRETFDLVEKIGVEKTKEVLDKADLILLVIDASTALSDQDRYIFSLVKGKNVIVLLNKIDLPVMVTADEIKKDVDVSRVLKISIKEGIGIDALEDYIWEYVYEEGISSREDVLVTNVRHKNSLVKAVESLKKAYDTAKDGLPFDFITIDLKDALNNLGEITGEALKEDIIDKLFENFCIGK